MLRKTILLLSLVIFCSHLSLATEQTKPQDLMGMWQLRTRNYEEIKKKCYKKIENCLVNVEEINEILKSSFFLDLMKDEAKIRIDLELLLKDLGWDDAPELTEILKEIATTDNEMDLNWFVVNNELVLVSNDGEVEKEKKLYFSILESNTKIVPKTEEENKIFGSFYKISL